MTHYKPTLSTAVRTLNFLGELVESTRARSADVFNQEALFEAAIQATGLEDFGDPYFEEGLSVLLQSANREVDFHFLGRSGFKRMVTLHLANRLALVEEQKRNRSQKQVPLNAPIIIIGLPRSGTTFLHRMLLTDPHNHAFPIWQMLRIFRHDQPDKRRQIAKRELTFARLLFPSIDKIHFSRVDTPEECFTLMGLTFFSRLFWTYAPLYGYLDWYIQQDRFRPYQDYAAILHAFQQYTPKRRFAMKAPMHTASIKAIRRVIPEAMIIQVHREPAQAFSSLNSLFFNLHSRSQNQFDLTRTIEHNLRTWDIELAQNMAMRETDPGPMLDIYYEQLRSNPQGVVRGIYEHFGLKMSDEHLENLQAYILENPQGSYGKHHYRVEDFGLNEENLNARFADYRNTFGYPRPMNS